MATSCRQTPNKSVPLAIQEDSKPSVAPKQVEKNNESAPTVKTPSEPSTSGLKTDSQNTSQLGDNSSHSDKPTAKEIPCEISLADSRKESPLFQAIRYEDVEAVRNLLAQGASLGGRNKCGETALEYTIDPDIFEMLLQKAKPADVNAKRDGDPLIVRLMMTAAYLFWDDRKTHFIELLVKKGADVNATTDAGTTALMIAALDGQLEIVKALLKNGADVNAKTIPHGDTALNCATEGNHTEVIRILIEHGAVE